MKACRFNLIILFTCLLSLPSSAFGAEVGYSFDIDDNILRVPTKIVAFDIETGKEVLLTTAEFAEWRERDKMPGSRYHRLEIDPSRGSFRFFRDGSENYLLRDLKLGMSQSKSDWKGPVFDAFVKAMSDPKSAANTTLITARGHSPETIMEALRLLQIRGFIKHLPRTENIWAVSQPKFFEQYQSTFGRKPPGGSADEPSERKAAVMEELLDRINKKPINYNSGRKRHTWGFSDDDIKNFEEAKEVLQKGVNKGRWKNIKIVLFYTGLGTPDVKPHAIVLQENAKPRPARPPEMGEIADFMQGREKLASDLNLGVSNCNTNDYITSFTRRGPNLWSSKPQS